MKTVFNIVLVLCAAALIYICYTSIMGPINFENAKKEREKAVIARLIDIRKAQQEYRSLHRGMYAPQLDTLIDFVKNQKLPFVMKMGMLTDKQLEDGLTEKKAMAIIEKAKKRECYDGIWNPGEDRAVFSCAGSVYDCAWNYFLPQGGGWNEQFLSRFHAADDRDGVAEYRYEQLVHQCRGIKIRGGFGSWKVFCGDLRQ